MIYIRDFVFCFLATIFFAYLMNNYKKFIFLSSILSGIGYVIYDYIILNYNDIFIAYFCSTIFISFFGEIISYAYKVPSIVIVFPSVIAFVPGIGLYNSLVFLIKSEYKSFIIKIVETIIIALEMAFIIAINTYIFKIILKINKKVFKNRKSMI